MTECFFRKAKRAVNAARFARYVQRRLLSRAAHTLFASFSLHRLDCPDLSQRIYVVQGGQTDNGEQDAAKNAGAKNRCDQVKVKKPNQTPVNATNYRYCKTCPIQPI
jgi:hypothetical protein